MADGIVEIKVKVDGKDVEATISGMDKLQGSSKKAASGMKELTASMIAVKVGSAALKVLNDALSDSIKRFDTIERYPKVMESLGYSADVSSASIQKLSDGIEGLPTTLDSVVSSAQRMTTITGNLGKSTDAVLALNNSFMANGASVSDAQRGMTQYIQMLSKGTVDIVSWRTLQETMGVALRKTAEEMGYLGTNGVNQLYSALQSGKTTFAEFQDNLIKIGTGTGEIAQLAQENSKGIETSFQNLRTAVVRNLADMVKVFDEMSEKITGKGIADNLNSLKGVVNSTFGVMKTVVRGTTPVFEAFASVVKSTIKVAKTLSPAIEGVVAAYVAMKVISKANGLMEKSNALIKTAQASEKGLTTIKLLHNTATAKGVATKGADATATKAQTAAQAAQNGTIGIGTAVIGVMTGSIKLHEAATIAATAATTAFNAAIGFLTSPIGVVVTLVGIFTGAMALQKKQLDEATSSTNEIVGATEELTKKTSESTAKIKENIAARNTEIEDIDVATDAYNGLVGELESLINSEHKTATEKKRIQAIVESLNGSVEGLGLAYDKESDSLSVGTAQLKKRVETLQAAQKAQEAQKQIVDINKDIAESEGNLNALYEKRKSLEKEMADNRNVTAQEFDQHRIKMLEDEKSYQAALDETNAAIKTEEENNASLKTQAEDTNAAIVSSQAEVDAAIQNGVMNQTMSYALLSDSQKEAVDSMNSKWQEYEEQATNMFDALSNEQTMSVQEMIANLQTNQQVMSEWADNITILADRGVRQGLLDKLRDAGPESAGYVAALVTASDEELQQLNAAFDNGGTTATESLKKAFDFEGSGISESITGLVTQTQGSLRTQMAAADFASIGADTGNNLAQGVTNSAGQVRASGETLGSQVPAGASAGIQKNQVLVEDAVTRLANSAKDNFANPLGIHSPSTVFTNYGQNIDEGLKNGISNRRGAVIAELRSLSAALPRVFDGLQSEFMQIGAYLMQGLAIGIQNNADTAVAAAQSAAARVKAATAHSYDERSPSKWMKDWVAKYLMMGQAEGLEKYAHLPVKAMERVSEAIKLPAITAEAAIGNGFQTQFYTPRAASRSSTNDNTDLVRAIIKLSNRPVTTSLVVDSREIAR
ncbi:tape measure protein, partial [Muricomes intestini]|uniref:tape measure protein n=1 Tax=Muricomes intestini TaxID=1796634 RepID=UPI002FDE9DF0